MIDVVKPDEEYSVSHFTLQATAVIDDIQKETSFLSSLGAQALYSCAASSLRNASCAA